MSKARLTAKKRKKDPTAPKTPASAYILFGQKERLRMLEGNPHPDIIHEARTVSDAWLKMTDEEKAPYEAKAQEDKARYDRELAVWKANQPAR
ncbi:hypothetical protein ACQEVM_37300 [Streptomyces sp. CA-243310]|uniref:hypothetical protein n=1 Tax=Streptomyces sp. CA-243310 TaxID=3240056 RepID=UPI003D8EFAA7